MRTYLDTSAWNKLADGIAVDTTGEVVFSSCNLDEFGMAPRAGQKVLAQLAWEQTNKAKLLDHVELMAAEIRGEDKVFDDEDPNFIDAWTIMRGPGLPAELDAVFRAQSQQAKQEVHTFLCQMRDQYRASFAEFRRRGLSTDWDTFMHELVAEGRLVAHHSAMFADSGYRVDVEGALAGSGYRDFPATATWSQYYFALGYLAAHGEGRISRPDSGDQVDHRHAVYAGVVDVFVTGDWRMHEILTTMVDSKIADVRLVDG